MSRVLMMVGNGIHHDTRVLKSALALADGGVDVTLLGVAPGNHRQETRLGGVRVIRVPVNWRLKDRRDARMRRLRRRHLTGVGVNAEEKRLIELEARQRRREKDDFGAPEYERRAKVGRARREVVRIRNGVDRRIARVEEGAIESAFDWWGRQEWGAKWRQELPQVDDLDLAYTPEIDRLEWDVIHAHDVHHVGTAARAVARRRAQGREAKWVYDAHEFVAGLSVYPPRTPRSVAAWLDLEQEFVRDADAVITVTAPLAAELQRRYELPLTPTVVMNVPVVSAPIGDDRPGVREACDLGPDTPLVVYSGAVTRARGVHTIVEALPALPGVHLAVVCVPSPTAAPAQLLREQAEELGVADRLHLFDPVAPHEVSDFLASADVSVNPMAHFGSHEFALPNKLFESLCAGLPLAVSDCRATAEFVRAHDVGTVFTAEDAADAARAIREVFDDLPRLRARIAGDPDLLSPYTWERQARHLRDLYRRLLGPDAVPVEPPAETLLRDVSEALVLRDDRASVVGIGPANMAGQGWAWGRAIERFVPGARAQVMVVDRNLPLLFPADETVPVDTFTRDRGWMQLAQAGAVARWTHALLEAGRPVFGLRNGDDFVGDAEVLLDVGIRVGLILHGSEARNPTRHATTTPWSPFADPNDPLTVRLRRQWYELAPKVSRFMDEGQGPVFVSTPDLLDDIPGTILLPVVVDVEAFATDAPVLERERPVVLHAPSNAALKGTHRVAAVLSELDAEGVVEFRHLEHVPPQDMPAALADVDILLDQFALGSYGVLAAQGMAAGRVVLGHVTDTVRERVRENSGLDLPVLEANPDTLADVLRGVVADREGARARAAQGVAFARSFHDGAHSTRVLVEHLGIRGQ